MHPDIIKFWEEAGYTIDPGFPDDRVIFMRSKPNEWGVSRLKPMCFNKQYHFKNKWLSEEEMLRIINLKAFL